MSDPGSGVDLIGLSFGKGGQGMVKKIMVVLLLLFLRLSAADAWQQETDGFGGLHWGMPVSQVKSSYDTKFIRYGKHNVEQYRVTVPHASRELGLYGPCTTVCTFRNNELMMIGILLFRSPDTVDRSFDEAVTVLTERCGVPETFRDEVIWPGKTSFLGLTKRPAMVEITLMGTRYLKACRKPAEMKNEYK